MSTVTSDRDHLLRALRADLVGPFSLDPASKEVLHLPPSRWYLTGFLAPEGGRDEEDRAADDDLVAGSIEDGEEPAAEQPLAKQKRWYPASMGMSVLLPPLAGAGAAGDSLRATVSFARYTAIPRDELAGGGGAPPELRADASEDDDEGGESSADAAQRRAEETARKRVLWRRRPAQRITVDVPLDASALLDGLPLPGEPRVRLFGKLGEASAPGLEPGTRALSLFVVNAQESGPKGRKDEAFLFQVELELRYDRGLVPRPDPRGDGASAWDDRVADLQFRERAEYAVGHVASVEVVEDAGGDAKRGRVTSAHDVAAHRRDPPGGAARDLGRRDLDGGARTARRVVARGGGSRGAHRAR